MDDRLRTGLREATLHLYEVSQHMNAEMVVRVDPALSKNSGMMLLSLLHRDGALRPRQISDALGLSAPGVSSLLQRAEAVGAVRRSSGGHGDGRSVTVSLTALGRRMFAETDLVVRETFEMHRPHLKSMLDVLSVALGDSVLPPGSAIPLKGSTADVQFTLALLGERLIGAIQSGHDGAPVENSVLYTVFLLDSVGSFRPGYVVDRFRLTSGGVSRILDRVEELGYGVRSYGSDVTDRRAITVTPTVAGEALVSRSAERMIPLAPMFHAAFRDAYLVLGSSDL